MEKQFERTIQLLGEEGFNKISRATVLLFGLGGVGGMALESLVRSGVGNVIIVDFDKVDETNLNRQILFLKNDVGNSKIDSTLLKLHNINPNINVECYGEKVDHNFFSHHVFKDVNYVAGDFADAEVLKRAFIDKAKRVLVISDISKARSEMEIDSQTVLAVLTMKNLNSSVYVAAEIIDRKFEEHLSLAKCDEIILTQEYEHSLLATASSGKGYSNVIKSLISDDAESGIIIDNIPSSYIGKQYKSLLDYYHTEKTEVLVGLLLKNHETMLTPKDDFVIPKDSKLILICANY